MTIPFSLIICTYMRPNSVQRLMNSIQFQVLYPNQILIIDGSTNDVTAQIIKENNYTNVQYYKIDESQRGLTKQRNFGISKLSDDSEIVCFLDDDTELENDYFKEIIHTFDSDPTITGVGGVAINENKWKKTHTNKTVSTLSYYYFEGFRYKEGLRHKLRKVLNLQSNLNSGFMPPFSHGRNCGYPPTGKIYEVDLLIGMAMSFRKKVVSTIKFSNYFEGYGLYEDADFSIRAQQFGKNVVATNAKLSHFHDASGRPNFFKYGKMVIRNGWYVWRVKYPKPTLKNKFKWYIISLLLLCIRILNIFTTSKPRQALQESLGRTSGLISLIFSKPIIN